MMYEEEGRKEQAMEKLEERCVECGVLGHATPIMLRERGRKREKK